MWNSIKKGFKNLQDWVSSSDHYATLPVEPPQEEVTTVAETPHNNPPIEQQSQQSILPNSVQQQNNAFENEEKFIKDQRELRRNLAARDLRWYCDNEMHRLFKIGFGKNEFVCLVPEFLDKEWDAIDFQPHIAKDKVHLIYPLNLDNKHWSFFYIYNPAANPVGSSSDQERRIAYYVDFFSDPPPPKLIEKFNAIFPNIEIRPIPIKHYFSQYQFEAHYCGDGIIKAIEQVIEQKFEIADQLTVAFDEVTVRQQHAKQLERAVLHQAPLGSQFH